MIHSYYFTFFNVYLYNFTFYDSLILFLYIILLFLSIFKHIIYCSKLFFILSIYILPTSFLFNPNRSLGLACILIF